MQVPQNSFTSVRQSRLDTELIRQDTGQALQGCHNTCSQLRQEQKVPHFFFSKNTHFQFKQSEQAHI